MNWDKAADIIKWIATAFIVTAVFFRSQHEHSLQIYDIIFSFVGCLLWVIVGTIWKDRAVITLNGILTSMLFLSLLDIFG